MIFERFWGGKEEKPAEPPKENIPEEKPPKEEKPALDISPGDFIVSKSGTRRRVLGVGYADNVGWFAETEKIPEAGAGEATISKERLPFAQIIQGQRPDGWVLKIEKPGEPKTEKSPEQIEVLDIYIGDVLVSAGSGNRRTIKKLDYRREVAEVETEKPGGTFSFQTLTFEQIKEALHAGRIRIEKVPRKF